MSYEYTPTPEPNHSTEPELTEPTGQTISEGRLHTERLAGTEDPSLDTSAVEMAPDRGPEADIDADGWQTDSAKEFAEAAEVREVDPRSTVSFRIVEADQTTSNGPHIAKALAGCTVAVFEVGGGTPVDRAKIQEAMDAMLRPDANHEDWVTAGTYLRRCNLEYIATTLQNRPEGLEKARLFGPSAADPAFASVQRVPGLIEQTTEQARTFATNQELRDTIVATARQVGASTTEREADMAEQLDQIAHHEATAEPQVIGAVIGTSPIRTANGVGALGYESSPVEAPDDLPKGHLTHLFKAAAADPSAEPDPEVVDRALIELTAQSHGFSDRQAFALGAALPPEKMTELLQALDQAKAADASSIDEHSAIRTIIQNAQQELEATSDQTAFETTEANLVPQERVRFHFVECDHGEGNAKPIADALAGCTTVVFEMAGGTPELRTIAETAMRTMRDQSLSLRTRAEAYGYLRKSNMGYVAETLRYLPSSVERVKLFDIVEGHPALPLLQISRELSWLVERTIARAEPNAVIQKTLTLFLEIAAEQSIPRETEAMPEQLWDIAVEEAHLPPHAVGVVTGGVHTGPRHSMVQRNFACSATLGLVDPNPFVMSSALETRLLRQRIENPERAFDPLDIDRLLLERIARTHGFDGHQAAALVTALPPDALQTILRNIDSIKQVAADPDDVQHAIWYTIFAAPVIFNLPMPNVTEETERP